MYLVTSSYIVVFAILTYTYFSLSMTYNTLYLMLAVKTLITTFVMRELKVQRKSQVCKQEIICKLYSPVTKI